MDGSCDNEPTTSPYSNYLPLFQTDRDPLMKSARMWSLVQVSVLLGLVMVVALSFGPKLRPENHDTFPMCDQNCSMPPPVVSRGVSEGVSDKSTSGKLTSEDAYDWTESMLEWQRTSYHFHPAKNWMNDPDAPLWYKGWYHLFYQWNPDSAVWGNITWAHAVSLDLIHWLYLPLAMVPDHWYDINGVWTGSATFIPNNNNNATDGDDDVSIVILYTGSTNSSLQVQNLAVPADPTDPLLTHWVKSGSNPVLLPPPGIGPTDFRDPTTAWFVPTNSTWRVAIGSKNAEHDGIALVYETQDFLRYQLLPGVMHSVTGTGMWECLDFYPVSTVSEVGLDTSVGSGPGVKHLMKASLDDDKHDYYAIGTYDEGTNTWWPDDEEKDVGIGLRHDYGKYYASKSFYDVVKRRRVLWGWTGETDSETTDLRKGWASVQTIPRTVLYDNKTGSNILQWPVEEVENLRTSSQEFNDTELDVGSVVPLVVGKATQLDIEAKFEIEPTALAEIVEADVGYNCSTSNGAYGRSALGPFGLLVLSAEDLSEQTAVYFYITRRTDSSLGTFFCTDELRSSKANDLIKRVYGSTVPVLDGETLSVRILVDHSIVESFAQGGRTCITSRVYPTEAIYGSARVFLFNNATGSKVTAKSVKIWQMSSAFIGPYEAQAEA